MEPLVIYIADNQYLSFLGLSSLFRSFYGPDTVVEQIISKEILEFKISQAVPSIIAIDYLNFDKCGVFDIYAVQKIVPTATLFVVSENQDSKQIKEVIKAGVSHYLFKSSAEDDFFNALRAIQNKRKYIGGDIYDILLQKEKKSYDISDNHKLSPSEVEIVKLIANGNTTKEIADIKNLSFHTINTHRKNIFRKLNICNASELVKYAINTGLMNDIDYYI